MPNCADSDCVSPCCHPEAAHGLGHHPLSRPARVVSSVSSDGEIPEVLEVEVTSMRHLKGPQASERAGRSRL